MRFHHIVQDRLFLPFLLLLASGEFFPLDLEDELCEVFDFILQIVSDLELIIVLYHLEHLVIEGDDVADAHIIFHLEINGEIGVAPMLLLQHLYCLLVHINGGAMVQHQSALSLLRLNLDVLCMDSLIKCWYG